MEFYQIRYFLAVCNHMNFTKAAAVCHVSQPALTKAIQKLEADLGGELFIREGRHFELTGLGRAMQTHLARVEETRTAAQRAARVFVNLEMTEINVGIMCTVGPFVLGPALLELQRESPGVELILHDIWGKRAYEFLLSGMIDCAILARTEPLPERFVGVPLYEEPLVLAMQRNDPLGSERHLSLKSLAGQSYFDRLRCEFRDAFFDVIEESGVMLDVTMRCEREDWILSRIADGHGISMMPLYSIFSDQIISRSLDDLTPVRTVEFVTVANRQMPTVVAAIAEILSQHQWPSETNFGD